MSSPLRPSRVSRQEGRTSSGAPISPGSTHGAECDEGDSGKDLNILGIGRGNHTNAEVAGSSQNNAQSTLEALLHVPEHVVRLNAAWDALDPDEPSSQRLRVNLPVDWRSLSWPGGATPRRLRLSRRFGRPVGLEPNTPSARARLLIDGAAAVVAVEIEGQPLSWHTAETDRLVVDLPVLAIRNLATIEIAVERAQGIWGGVWLVFGGEAASA